VGMLRVERVAVNNPLISEKRRNPYSTAMRREDGVAVSFQVAMAASRSRSTK
jgi:hypothetical protein